jgi:hypothetical protein
MKRRSGWWQRAARAAKVFRVRVVALPDEAEPDPEPRPWSSRGRPPGQHPPTQYRNGVVATFVTVLERLFPSWKSQQVRQAVNDHLGLTLKLRTFFKIKGRGNHERGIGITLDAQSPVTQGLWSLLAETPKGTREHPMERRIKELMQRWTITAGSKIDPSQLDLNEDTIIKENATVNGYALAAREIGYRGVADQILEENMSPASVARLLKMSAGQSGYNTALILLAGANSRYRAAPVGWSGEHEETLAREALARQYPDDDLDALMAKISEKAARLIEKHREAPR